MCCQICKHPIIISLVIVNILGAVLLIIAGKEFFRTCNVLPFICTHFVEGKKTKVHAKQKGFKRFFIKESLITMGPNSLLIRLSVLQDLDFNLT